MYTAKFIIPDQKNKESKLNHELRKIITPIFDTPQIAVDSAKLFFKDLYGEMPEAPIQIEFQSIK